MRLERPILIGGAPSSGTTLLSVMLDAHPEIYCGPELGLLSHPALYRGAFEHYAQGLLNRLERCEWERNDALHNVVEGFCPYALIDEGNLFAYEQDLASLKRLLRESADASEFIGRLFTPLLERQGKSILAEKTPSNLYAFESLLERFQLGKVLYMVRDPRAVVASLIRRGMSLRRSIAIWLLETAISERIANHPRVLRVRYEDLVLNTEVVVREILGFLEVTPEVEAVLEYHRRSTRIEADKTLWMQDTWQANPAQPISRQALDVWRGELDQPALAIMERSLLVGAPQGMESLVGTGLLDLAERLGYVWEPNTADSGEVVQRLLAERLVATAYQAFDDHVFQERFVEASPALELEHNGLWEVVLNGQAKVFEQEKQALVDARIVRRQCCYWYAEHQKAMRAMNDLMAENDRLVAESGQLVAERDRLGAERDRLGAERDQLSHYCRLPEARLGHFLRHRANWLLSKVKGRS